MNKIGLCCSGNGGKSDGIGSHPDDLQKGKKVLNEENLDKKYSDPGGHLRDKKWLDSSQKKDKEIADLISEQKKEE